LNCEIALLFKVAGCESSRSLNLSGHVELAPNPTFAVGAQLVL
jgi:hypothetical protein